MKLLKSTLAFMLMLFTLSCLTVAPAFAADTTTSDSHISIEVDDSGGIVFKPGTYPDLGDTGMEIQEQAAEMVVDKTKMVAQTITAICALVSITSLIYNITRLSTSPDMAFVRRQRMVNIGVSVVCLALFGGSWIIVTLAWNFFS